MTNEELLDVVESVRDKRLEQRKQSAGGAKTESDMLLGWCKKNSKLLKKRMKQNEHRAEIGGGLIRSGLWTREENLPDTFKEAISQRHPIHYWVLVGDTYVCEVASESDIHYGEPIALQAHPEQLGYVTFPDTYNVDI